MGVSKSEISASIVVTGPQHSDRKRILGYTDKLTVRPGERIEFKISSERGEAYVAQLVRLINGDVRSEAADFKEIEIASSINGTYEGRQQPIVSGSCVVVENADLLSSLNAFTVVINFMPTAPMHGVQHLLSCLDASTHTGWSLHLDDKGQLSFTSARDRRALSTLAISEPLAARTWYVAALRVNWRAETAGLACRAIRVAYHQVDLTDDSALTDALGERGITSCPLVIAAAYGGRDAGGRIVPVGCFNGRLEAPVIYRGVLSDEDLERVMAGERPASLSAHRVADWNFSKAIPGTRIEDCAGNGFDGCLRNMPVRAVKGSRWAGNTMEWQHDPAQYAAIHFHSDDLHDCGWLTDISYQVPDLLRSGVYALRLRVCGDSGAASEEEYLPFFFAAPRNYPSAKIAFMVPTHTYVAYGNVAFGADRKESGLSDQDYFASSITGPGTMEYSLVVEAHPELSRSVYERHVDGSPVHFSSWLRPLLNMRPKSILWTFCADLLIIDWLEAQGFEYDVITDDLVNQEGMDVLKPYRVVVTGNHPEYVTAAQLNAIESYLDQGGHLMYLGGNGFYWRTAVQPALPGVIEVRRGRTGTGTWQSEVGESGLAFSGEPGGIWRDLGRPPQRLVGVGFIAEGRDASHYRILPEARDGPSAFIFEGVEGDVIGEFGIFGDGAAGQEIDKTSSAHGTPSHAIVVARSEQHGVGMLYVIEEMVATDPVIEKYRSLTCAEVVYFRARGGGAVFSVGSMAWCGSLSHNGYDNNVSRITANVLNRFAFD